MAKTSHVPDLSCKQEFAIRLPKQSLSLDEPNSSIVPTRMLLSVFEGNQQL